MFTITVGEEQLSLSQIKAVIGYPHCLVIWFILGQCLRCEYGLCMKFHFKSPLSFVN